MTTSPTRLDVRWRAPARATIVRAVVVHDDAMLARVTSVLGVQPIGSFRYDVDAAGSRAVVELEVTGTPQQVARVQHLLRRLVGVLEVREPSSSAE
jgi:hypothetical protein